MKNPFISKKNFKRRHKYCQICGEDKYELLDTHRWKIEGKNGGKYTNDNCLCICVKCHRLIHLKKIIINGVYNSTTGKLLNYMNEDGEEYFHKI